jgi:ABC-type branched-subunit amino acid transport system ATPase component
MADTAPPGLQPGTATGPSAGGSPLLAVDSVDVYYGSVQVLFGTTFSVGPGEAVALLGTNGSGKSTLLKTVAGLVHPRQGTVIHRGQDLAGRSAEDRVRRGIGLVCGGQAVFRSLTVHDNLRSGAFALRGDKRMIAARIGAVLDLLPALKPLLRRRAGLCSGGEQQQLAIAKALLLEPQLLMVDELSLGLAPVVVSQLIDVVAALRAAGKTLIIVEQSLNVALHLAERALFMEKGCIRFEGATRDLQDRDDIARAVFLGQR